MGLNGSVNVRDALAASERGMRDRKVRAMAQIVSTQGPTSVYETTATWKDQNTKEDREDTGRYNGPASFETFVAFLQSLPAEVEKEASYDKEAKVLGPYSVSYAFDCFMQGLDARVKAKIRPAVAQESAWISRDDVRINLATGEREKDSKPMAGLSLEKCIGAINAGYQQAELLGSEKPTAAFIVARRKLIEDKLATMKGDVLVIVPGAKFPTSGNGRK